MTLKSGGGALAGGTITVNGVSIVIPDNSIVTLPATAVSWPELFINPTTPNLPGWPGSQSWTATISGNRVNDVYYAGLVYIAQSPDELLQGFITSIDPKTGHFTVGGAFGTKPGGIDCVINDPLGIYAPVYTSNPLWSVDPLNPSIHSQTGFPMCIPDATRPTLCPANNRIDPGTGKPFFIFTMKAPGPGVVPDPLTMVPLIVGDYITFSGQQVGSTYEINNLEANVGIFTAPDTTPAYVTVEAVEIGMTSPATGNFAIGETKSVAWTTGPTTLISWYAQDVDWCTGNITERLITSIQPENTGPPLGRAIMRLGKIPMSPATRNVIFRLSTGTVATNTANKFLAGQYVQPVMEFTFPELTVAGGNFAPNAFEVMPFLALGSGPYQPGNVLTSPLINPPQTGQLNPWPGAIPPAIPSACSTPLPPSPTPSAIAPEKLVIVSAVQSKARQGFVQIVVSCTDSIPSANLFVSIAGANNVQNPLTNAPMITIGEGTYTLTANNKAAGLTLVVTSDKGASQSVKLAAI